MFCDMEDNASAIFAVAKKLKDMEYATETAVTDAEKLVMFQALLAELGQEINLAKQMVKTQIREIGGDLLNPKPKNQTLDLIEVMRNDVEKARAVLEKKEVAP
jgi:hypothetical protein